LANPTRGKGDWNSVSGVLRALSIKIMGEPMVQASTKGREGSVCSGVTVEVAGGKGQYAARTCRCPPWIVKMALSSTLRCDGSAAVIQYDGVTTLIE